MKTKENALIIFVKNPKLGHAKTRIAANTSDLQALDIYNQLLEITANTCTKLAVDKYVYYSQYIDDNDLWNNLNFYKNVQVSGDLGTKMNAAFARILKQYKKAIIIGSDCPYISRELLLQAFDHLNNHQVVIGPVVDGGYYLLGMDAHYPTLFEDMQYSTDQVYKETIKRIEDDQLSYQVLDTLQDIDYYEDWLKYLESK